MSEETPTCPKSLSTEPMCGGLGPEHKIDDRIKAMVVKFKQDVEKHLGRLLEHFEPVSYRSQVVAGMNHFVKCHIGGDDYVHLSIYEPLPCYKKEPELTKIHPEIKKLEDPIDFIE